MEKIIDGMKISYEVIGGSGEDIVMLHGWGQNKEMMYPLAKRLKNKFRLTIIDLPGFGGSYEPDYPVDIYEYTAIIEKFLGIIGIKNPILIGHSFGGRIAIIYASRNETKKVVLFGAPCIRERKRSKKEIFFKFLKKIPGSKKLVSYAKKHMGSYDYRNASPVMREILVKTVNEDLSECAKKIKAPTLLIWGEKDTEAKVSDAKKLEKIIPDAGLIVIPNCTHFAYLEAIDYITNILNKFF